MSLTFFSVWSFTQFLAGYQALHAPSFHKSNNYCLQSESLAWPGLANLSPGQGLQSLCTPDWLTGLSRCVLVFLQSDSITGWQDY